MEYQSEQINELAAALAKAQGEFTPAIKDSANPFYKSKYANLCSINKACQEPLSKNGLSITQSTVKDASNQWVLITKLLHSSGQWLASTTPIITSKPDIQAFGSATSYARRYALSAIVGVVTDEDDDGEAAMDRKEPVNVKPVYINQGQITYLTNMINRLEERDQEEVWKRLGDQGITEYAQIPVDTFNKMLTHINSKIKAPK